MISAIVILSCLFLGGMKLVGSSNPRCPNHSGIKSLKWKNQIPIESCPTTRSSLRCGITSLVLPTSAWLRTASLPIPTRRNGNSKGSCRLSGIGASGIFGKNSYLCHQANPAVIKGHSTKGCRHEGFEQINKFMDHFAGLLRLAIMDGNRAPHLPFYGTWRKGQFLCSGRHPDDDSPLVDLLFCAGC